MNSGFRWIALALVLGAARPAAAQSVEDKDNIASPYVPMPWVIVDTRLPERHGKRRERSSAAQGLGGTRRERSLRSVASGPTHRLRRQGRRSNHGGGSARETSANRGRPGTTGRFHGETRAAGLGSKGICSILRA